MCRYSLKKLDKTLQKVKDSKDMLYTSMPFILYLLPRATLKQQNVRQGLLESQWFLLCSWWFCTPLLLYHFNSPQGLSLMKDDSGQSLFVQVFQRIKLIPSSPWSNNKSKVSVSVFSWCTGHRMMLLQMEDPVNEKSKNLFFPQI